MPTMNRDMATLVAENYLLKSGKGRATAYRVILLIRIPSGRFTPLSEAFLV